MNEYISYKKTVIKMILIFILITVTGFIVSILIESKLQLQRGKIINYTSEKINSIDNNLSNLSEKEDYYRIYQVKDDETGEISEVRIDDIMFPYNFFIDLFKDKSIIYSNYRNAGLYNIMIGWKVVGILGTVFCSFCLIRNPYKDEQ